ncbi:nuclear pore complex protein Nup107 [Lepeophtheirus salmonis]|uniref:nuclear pore complex protein Nup107 n=1 Tax=Lepeophtheirus salmonis TaxID=72036 RepID=UPI001AEA98FB|nr:nuclear pore complex protein Nup107-like [Lepeophtheirus salmonis]
MDGFETPVLLKGKVSRILKRQSEFLPTPKLEKSLNASDIFLGKPGDFTMGMDLTSAPYPLGETNASFGYSMMAYEPMEHRNKTLAMSFAQGSASTEHLFPDFLATVSESTAAFKTLDQVAEFQQLVGDQYEAHCQMPSKSGTASKMNATHLKNLMEERNTWRLLGKLYHDRLRTMDKDEDMEDTEEGDTLNLCSEKIIVEKLFRRNQELREAQAIVDWLEANKGDSTCGISAERFSDATVSWENTLHSLNHPNANKRNLITQLDPDAPRRQNKPLHDLDMQDQNLLYDAIFIYIRSGMLESAQDLCIKLGQPWRAATLEGWKLFHDENYNRADTNKKLPCEGNKTRDVWKRSAWKMTCDEKMPSLERAAYSAFCGNVNQLLSICKNWDDCLWALTRCYIDLMVEKEIRNTLNDKTYAKLPQEYWDDNKTSMDDVLKCMETLDNEGVKSVKTNPYKIIQCYLISQNYRGLLEKMMEWVKEPQDPHLLRLLCHFIIVFRRLNIGQNDCSLKVLEDAIIQIYVIYLMGADLVQLVAWYTAQLPTNIQIDIYSKFLENVTTYGDRKLCLDLAMESDLPIQDITTQVVVNIRTQEEADEEATFQPVMTERDKRKIDALSWLIFFDSQRDEAIFQCNALVRSFIAAGKVESANEAILKVPEDSISLIKKQNEDVISLPPQISNCIREFLGLQSYLQAQEAFSDWFNHFSKGQPRRPVLGETSSFVEKVAFEQKQEQYQVEMERWNSAQLIQSRAATERLFGVLTFPQGWLVDEVEEISEESIQRKEELEYLRKICIPKLVLLLHSVYHSSKQFKEAIKLADLVASERYEIYQLYSKDKLRELLNKIHESSVAAMETGTKDPWGFPKK